MPEDLMLPVEHHAEQSMAGLDGISASEDKDNENVAEFKVPGPKRKQHEWMHLVHVLRRHDGHRTRSAQELGMTTRMLRYKLAKLRESGVDVDSLIASPAVAC